MKFFSYDTLVGCVHTGVEMFGIHLPLWATVSTSAATIPATAYAQSEFWYWKDVEKAASLGARLAPKVPYEWPLEGDLMATMAHVFESGYLGKSYGWTIPCAEVLPDSIR
jgi:hypothetical protein